MDEATEWLLEGPAWVEYRTRVDLLDEPESAAAVRAARGAMLADPQVGTVLAELAGWPGRIISSHKDAGHPLHKLTFVADLGFRLGDPLIDTIVARAGENVSETGPFQLLMNIHPRYGGSGEDEWAWALCDTPLVLYALAWFGLEADPRVVRAADHLVGLARENGWPCAVSPALGKFRGPGRRGDPCPYANLAMLKALSQVSGYRDCAAARTGVNALLDLWVRRRECHPYMFFMGTDFCKLKAPLVWYDILHVLDVVSRFPWARGDARVGEMLSVVRAKLDGGGRCTAESVWKAWAGWEFGQKKTPSRWVTFLARRILKRMGAAHGIDG